MRRALVCLLLLICATAAWAAGEPPAMTFYTDGELRHAIQTAPAEPGQTGLYLLRLSPPSETPVIGIRRTAPATSELHTSFTDIWYVLEGSATLVTGGTMLEGTEIAPGETRGRGITDGASRRVQKGDYAVIPAGIPHWISRIEGDELLYIVVKVPVQKR